VEHGAPPAGSGSMQLSLLLSSLCVVLTWIDVPCDWKKCSTPAFDTPFITIQSTENVFPMPPEFYHCQWSTISVILERVLPWWRPFFTASTRSVSPFNYLGIYVSLLSVLSQINPTIHNSEVFIFLTKQYYWMVQCQ